MQRRFFEIAKKYFTERLDDSMFKVKNFFNNNQKFIETSLTH